MQYFFTVYSCRDINAYDSDEEIHAVFERIRRLNQKLQDEGRWAMFGGLVLLEDAMTVLPGGSHSNLPYYNAMTSPSAFWIVQITDEQGAINLTHEAAGACTQAVEVRAITEQHAG